MTFLNLKIANNAKSTVGANISAGATTLTCATWEGGRFPSTYPYYLTLEKVVLGVVTKREVVKVTARSTDSFTIVRSAWYCPGSASATTQTNTAYAFDTADIISLRIVAENIDDINAELVRLGLVLYPDASTTEKGISKLTVAPSVTKGTVTMTIASPAVASFTAHGLIEDDTIKFTTTGALPTGVVAGTKYYVVSTGLTSDAFQFSATQGGASVITTWSQSGTHNLYKVTPISVGDNDPRIPTQGENDASAGSYGTPSSSNKFVTETDPLYADNVKTTGDQSIDDVKTFTSVPVLPASDPTTSNQAVRKSYADSLVETAETTASRVFASWTVTLYYNRRWKLYYNFRVTSSYYIQWNGYKCPLKSDSTTVTEICSMLWKTYSSKITNNVEQDGDSVTAGYYDWSVWHWDNASLHYTQFLVSITVA